MAEPTANAIEPDYKDHRKKEILNNLQKYLLLFAGGLLSVLVYITNALFTDLGLTLLITLNLLGIYIGYLLVLKQLHIHSEYADKICSLLKQHDCNNVLESKAAKLWGVFGWSEIGLAYFIANTLILLFLPHFVAYLAIINILALPYSVWSVWYQKVKAKQWCVLCLIVQALFWLVFISEFLFGFIQLPNFNIIAWVFTGCIFAISILSINILIPKLSQEQQVSYLRQEINSLKANEDIFRYVLKQQPFHKTSKSDSLILFGNLNAKMLITVFSNPYCNPCALMHRRIEQLLEVTKNEICVQYILSYFEPSLIFANRGLIAVCLEKTGEDRVQIFSNWFEKGKSQKEAFFESLNLDMSNPEIETEFQKQIVWREKAKLNATPTILVNGYQLPENYKIEDLRYFTELTVDNQ